MDSKRNRQDNGVRQCAKWRCEADVLRHMQYCYEHVARYEIPPHAELECPSCGRTGPHGTIHDDLYYCMDDDCEELFDPRRTDYLESLQARADQNGGSHV